MLHTDARLLQQGASRLGLRLGEPELAQFRRYHQTLAEWNTRVNLTSVTEWDAVLTTHFLDSLTVAQAIPERVLRGGAVLDVGSGAGFPGVPLKIAFPQIALLLVEATGKKAAFLTHLVRELGLRNVLVLNARAEDLAHDPRHREQYDIALARALAPLPTLVELTLSFIKPGGRLIAQKKGDYLAELDASAYAVQQLGGRLEEIQPVDLPTLSGARALVVVSKVSSTPDRYPRRSGMPAHRPLLPPRAARAGLEAAPHA